MSVVRIRESPEYYRGFFLKEIYHENFVATLETVLDREVSVLERCPYREFRLYLFYFNQILVDLFRACKGGSSYKCLRKKVPFFTCK